MCETLTERSYSTNNILSYLYLSCNLIVHRQIIMQKSSKLPFCVVLSVSVGVLLP